jgi:Mn2+/Fe2+ NRAMP family transporter
MSALRTAPAGTEAHVPLPPALVVRVRDRLHIAALRRRSDLWGKVLLGLALIGPGVLVMLGDNDAGGVITYAQTGAARGLGFFIPLMIPLAFIAYIVQEMTIRLGAVTRRGHAELIWRRYGPFWGAFSLLDLVAANILTLMTEFIGIRVAGEVLGISRWVTVPAAVAFVAFVLTFFRYWTWERIALFVAAFNLVFVPLVLIAHPDWAAVGRAFLHPPLPADWLSASFLILISANIGTTIAPWQLFFQQSCVVDKGLLPKDIPAGRRDLALGVAGMAVVALSIIILTGQYLHGIPGADNFQIDQIVAAIASRVGHRAMLLFVLGLAEAGLIAAIVITASTAWAIGEAFDWPRSINDHPVQSLGFYLPSLAGTALAGGVILLPHVPLGFLNLSVQVIATVFMPAAMLFLLMLLNDRKLMGSYVNGPWRNAVSIAILASLIVCNALYGLATLFPDKL